MGFSGYELLPHLQALRTQLLEPYREDDERFRSAYFDLELLPYSLASCWQAVSETARLYRETVDGVDSAELHGVVFQGLKPETRDQLSFPVDHFFGAARRAQNAVIHYLGRGLRLSLPSSMNKLVRRLEAGRITIPAAPQRELLKYWKTHGVQLKHYRDLAQHHALVTSDARVMASADGRVGLYLLLPSNPEEKAAGRLRFGDPEIHALDYIKREFKVLVAFMDWLTKGLLAPSGGPRRVSLLAVPRDPVVLGPGVQHRALVPPGAAELESEVTDLIGKLKTQ